jgi:hypothetical protein
MSLVRKIEARYHVKLEGDGAPVSSFGTYELPTPGLLFEVKGERWRVDEVVLQVVSPYKEQIFVHCVVTLAYRWKASTKQWVTVSGLQDRG